MMTFDSQTANNIVYLNYSNTSVETGYQEGTPVSDCLSNIMKNNAIVVGSEISKDCINKK